MGVPPGPVPAGMAGPDDGGGPADAKREDACGADKSRLLFALGLTLVLAGLGEGARWWDCGCCGWPITCVCGPPPIAC